MTDPNKSLCQDCIHSEYPEYCWSCGLDYDNSLVEKVNSFEIPRFFQGDAIQYLLVKLAAAGGAWIGITIIGCLIWGLLGANEISSIAFFFSFFSICIIYTYGIGFLNNDNVPTDSWKAYRSKDKAGQVLAQSIKDGYSDLFNIYPDANRKDNEAIRNFFTAHTSVGQQVITAMTSTFKTLCELASFEKLNDTIESEMPAEKLYDEKPTEFVKNEVPSSGFGTLVKQSNSQGVSLNINIELHLPATQDGEIYEKLFLALNKHLLQG